MVGSGFPVNIEVYVIIWRKNGQILSVEKILLKRKLDKFIEFSICAFPNAKKHRHHICTKS